MNLYEIQNEILECLDEDGEIIDFERLEGLTASFDTKVGNVARWCINLAAYEKNCKERKEHFAAEERAARNKQERLKNYLAGVLDGRKWQDEDVKISFRKSVSVDVFGEVPEEYRVTEVISRPDKIKLKEALSEGEVIEGARLIEKNNISVK